jgi:hypothetical protein
MISIILLALTIWCGYKLVTSENKLLYSTLVLLIDGAWIAYNLYTHSYIYAAFWVVLLLFDTRTYQRYKNEQEED